MRVALLSFLALSLAACTSSPTSTGAQRTLQRADEAFLRGDFAQASYFYDSHLQDHPDEVQRAGILYQIGKCKLGEKLWEEGIMKLNLALEAGANGILRTEIFYRRAIAHNALWKIQEALQDFLSVEAAPADVRGRAVAEDEFRYRLGVTRIRTSDWKGGKADLARVGMTSRFGSDARVRMSLHEFSVQIAQHEDEASAMRGRSLAARRGLKARVHGEGETYLVLVGTHARFPEALEASRRLQALYPGAFVVP